MNSTVWQQEKTLSSAVSIAWTFVGCLLLAIGIATASLALEALNIGVIHRLPFPQSDRLLWISCDIGAELDDLGCSVPAAVSLRQDASSINDLAIYTEGQVRGGILDQDTIRIANVSSSFFSTLGMWPEQGRWFLEADETSANNDLAIVSDRLWSSLFGNAKLDETKPIVMDGRKFTIIGVMSASFAFPDPRTDAWLLSPVSIDKMQESGVWSSRVVIRVKPSADKKVVEYDLAQASSHLQHSTRQAAGVYFHSKQLRDIVTDPSQGGWIVFAAITSVLILLASSVGICLVGQCPAAEPVIMSRRRWAYEVSASTIIALLLVAIASRTASAGFEREFPRWILISSTPVKSALASIMCMFIVSFGSGYLAISIWRRFLSTGRIRLWKRTLKISCVLQILLAVGIITGTLGTMIGTLRLVYGFPGFNPDQLLALDIEPVLTELPGSVKELPIDRIVNLASSLPVVDHVSITSAPPLLPHSNGTWLSTGGSAIPEKNLEVGVTSVESAFFETMGVVFISGHAPRLHGNGEPRCTIVVNEALAERLNTNDLSGDSIVRIPNHVHSGSLECTIAGVIKNIEYPTSSGGAKPEILIPFQLWPSTEGALLVRIRKGVTVKEASSLLTEKLTGIVTVDHVWPLPILRHQTTAIYQLNARLLLLLWGWAGASALLWLYVFRQHSALKPSGSHNSRTALSVASLK